MLTPLPTWSSRASQSVPLAKETLERWIRAGGVKESETNVTSCRKASWFAQPESGLRNALSLYCVLFFRDMNHRPHYVLVGLFI